MTIGSKGEISFLSPPTHIPGSVVVSVSGNGQQYTKDETIHYRDEFNTFEYYQDFFITGIDPPAVSNRGHAEINIKGMLFNQFQTDPNQTIQCRYIDLHDQQYGSAMNMKQTAENEMKCTAPRTDNSGLTKL